MTTAHYVATYQSPNFCAAYRHGVLTIVRLRDGHSCTLNLTDTNRFRVDVMDYELSDDERDPVDRACAKHIVHLKKRKWVRAEFEGSMIAFHNEPVKVRADA
jgi:hypothetical protein